MVFIANPNVVSAGKQWWRSPSWTGHAAVMLCRECSDEAVKTVGPACGKCLVCLMYMDDSIAPWDV